MPTPRKLIAFLTLALTLSSTFVFADDCSDFGPGWVQGVASSSSLTVCIPTGDNPDGTIGSALPVLTQNGKEYYSPPAGTADTLKVDSTGRIARTFDEITRVIRADGSMYVYATKATFYTEAGAATDALWDLVESDPASFSSLAAALTASHVPPPAATSVVIDFQGQRLKIGSFLNSGYSAATPLGSYYMWDSVNRKIGYAFKQKDDTECYLNLFYYTVTTDPLSPTTLSNSKLSENISSSPESYASDIDKLIAQNPDSFKKSYTPSANEGLTSPPIPTALTPEKLNEIYVGNGAPVGAGLPIINPSTGSPVLPGNVAVPTPDTSGGSPDSPPSDIYGPGFTPGFNNAPYGSSGAPGGVDFGIRMSQFMTDLRGSSLFSLPTSILGNIPSSGTSAISFDGGQFGQHSLDFAAFSSQLMIIRSVLLLCFALLSIRIVTLKR